MAKAYNNQGAAYLELKEDRVAIADRQKAIEITQRLAIEIEYFSKGLK